MSQRPERILLGQVVGVSGLRGLLKIHSDTQPRDAIGNYDCWQLGKQDDWHTRQVVSVKPQGKRIIAQLADCSTREAAEALIGFDIAVDAHALDELNDGQYYWVDLQGLHVANLCGDAFGTIKRVFDTGANDVIVVKGGRERLIPWIMGDVIKAVDFQSGTVTVDWGADF